MGSADILQAIRDKIEQRKKSLRAGICNEEVFTRKQRKEMLVASEELDRLNRFLSTLEKSEKPINLDGLEEEIDKYREEHLFDMPAFQQVARYFAKWGAEHARG